jgi:GNAT superfamily N-acetyltransferase
LEDIERLEQCWHRALLTFPQAKDVKGAVISCYPALPMPQCNSAADINVNEDEAEDLLNRVTKHFESLGSSLVRFRITPLTRPRRFGLFLQSHGFEKKGEESIMVFKGGRLEEKLNHEVEVREISESEVDVGNRLVLKVFEFPIEWKKEFNKLTLDWMQKGGRLFVGYVDGKPVGTSFLFSLTKTGGIFTVGTLKEYRKRGIGTTLTVHALMESIKEGNDLHTLQTAKGGNAERLYKKVGFEVDHIVSWYVKERAREQKLTHRLGIIDVCL